jgi:hypothetical protein
MRRIDVPVYIGVMKCTMQNEKPLMVVQNEPFTHQDAFRDYRWFRTEVAIRIQDEVTETETVSQVEEVGPDAA